MSYHILIHSCSVMFFIQLHNIYNSTVCIYIYTCININASYHEFLPGVGIRQFFAWMQLLHRCIWYLCDSGHLFCIVLSGFHLLFVDLEASVSSGMWEPEQSATFCFVWKGFQIDGGVFTESLQIFVVSLEFKTHIFAPCSHTLSNWYKHEIQLAGPWCSKHV